jgi:hypothetical protein
LTMSPMPAMPAFFLADDVPDRNPEIRESGRD